MDIDQIKERKLAWAASLAESQPPIKTDKPVLQPWPSSWLDFYPRFWYTAEGQLHLERIASGQLTPLEIPHD